MGEKVTGDELLISAFVLEYGARSQLPETAENDAKRKQIDLNSANLPIVISLKSTIRIECLGCPSLDTPIAMMQQ